MVSMGNFGGANVYNRMFNGEGITNHPNVLGKSVI